MALTSARLVGYLRAEYEKAAKFRILLFFTQLAMSIPIAVSVLITNAIWTYVLAVSSSMLLLVWWAFNSQYQSVRNAAETARRAALLSNALPEQISPSEILSLKGRLTITEARAAVYEKADYYASKLPIGPARLGEILEESTYYSKHLHKFSASVMSYMVLTYAVIFITAALCSVPFLSQSALLEAARVYLSVLIFILSADVFGAYLSHRSTARALEEIAHRLVASDRSGYPIADVMLAMVDYNSAIESAPESVPFAYRFLESRLNQGWSEYQIDRERYRAVNRI